VGPVEIVFHQPFGQLFVKYITVAGKIVKADKLFFQGSVESLVKRIILRCFGTGEIMGDIQFLDSFPEIPGELGTVVCLDVFYLAV